MPQYAPFEHLQIGARIEAELLGQHGAGSPQGTQRVCLAS